MSLLLKTEEVEYSLMPNGLRILFFPLSGSRVNKKVEEPEFTQYMHFQLAEGVQLVDP
jgi:hypothetical protein